MANLDERMRIVIGRTRMAAGLSLQDLAERTGVSTSTLSRLETGDRRLTVELLDTLADALEISAATLVADAEQDDRLVLPTPEIELAEGMRGILLHTDDRGRQLIRITLPPRRQLPPGRTHAGLEWFHVLRGRVQLRVADREIILEAGQTTQFDCQQPHAFAGDGVEAEILSRFEHGAHRR